MRCLFLQHPIESNTGSLPAANNGANGDSQNFGGFGLGQLLVPKQRENVPFLFRQRIHLPVEFSPFSQGSWVVRIIGLIVYLLVRVAVQAGVMLRKVQ